MARNIEIKARITSVAQLLPHAQALAGGDAVLIEQDDSFFSVPHGRLKLRQFADGSADLIHYHRPDTGRRQGQRLRAVAVPDADALREALARAAAAWAACSKQLAAAAAVGQTRIHLDQVAAWVTSWNWKWCCKTASPTPKARPSPTR
jgi:adenylate cyclase class IV